MIFNLPSYFAKTLTAGSNAKKKKAHSSKFPDFADKTQKRPNSRLVFLLLLPFLLSSSDNFDMLRPIIRSSSRSIRLSSLPSSFRLPHLKPSSSSTRSESTLTSQKEDEGSIASVFSSLGNDAFVPLESRFSDLKRSLWNDGLIESWRDVLEALKSRTEEIRELGSAVSFFLPLLILFLRLTKLRN